MKAERKDGDKGRFYRLKGIDLPSVTTILGVIGKPALVGWAAKVEREMVIVESAKFYHDLIGQPEISSVKWATDLQGRLGKERAHKKELAKAAEIGSQAHALIEWTLRTSLLEKVGPSPEVGPKAQWAFSSWMRWREEVNLKPLMVETTVVHERLGYAGTMDLLAEVAGELTVLDWKTGKAIYPEAWLQNVAYRKAVKEMGLGNPKKGIIVRLPKVDTDPEFEVQEITADEDELFTVFLHAFEVWKWAA